MNRQDALERLCKLACDINSKMFNFDVPCDCFCGTAPFWNDHPIVDEKIIAFIEKAVRDQIGTG